MKYVPSVLTRTIGRAVLNTKANSPTVMFYGGIVGVVGAAALACKATLQLDAKLEEMAKERMDELTVIDNGVVVEQVNRKVYVKNVLTVAKLYAPAVGLGVVSIGMLAGSHRTLTNRNVALTAAYAALDKGFKEYRQRVIDDVGTEKELSYRFPLENVEELDEESGKAVKRTVIGVDGKSIYARFFDESNRNWSRSDDQNFYFIRIVQQHMNDQLKARGHVLLNDAYDALGMERTPEGCVVGWKLDNDGDNYIDFGIYDKDDERKRAFVHGRERSVHLDFNVDGVIYKKI